MPELPEVETVRRVLVGWIVNKKIKSVEFFYDKLISNMSQDEFKEKISNQKILSVDRRGKFLLINLEDYVLLSHLRMEGKYYLIKGEIKDPKINKHKMCIFHLDDASKLIYHDVRKFGRMKLLPKDDFEKDLSLTNLGKEPFDLKMDELYKKTQKTKRKIKEVLLDQSVISGLGNIYVDEVLFLSKIMPTRIADKVSIKECKIIIDNSIKVLNKAIELGGSTIRTYHFAGDVDGKFQNQLYVYGKTNQKCLICENKIEKIFVGGRGTHFCSKCQK